jgi:glycosyltransferase involved in cell wall biosynthesis
MRLLIDGQTLSTPDIERGIGRVLLKLMEVIGSKDLGDEIYVACYDEQFNPNIIPDSCSFKYLSLGARLLPGQRASEEYTEKICGIVDNYHIDVFWIPNPLMDNVHFTKKKPNCNVVITVYDLIPIVMEQSYFKNWMLNVQKEYLMRLCRLHTIPDYIITISDSTSQDLVQLLGINPNKISTVYLGCDCAISEGNEKGHIPCVPDGPYLIYVGGFDPRKNMHNAVLAFKNVLLSGTFSDLKLMIICRLDASSKKQFELFLTANGMQENVILKGHVTDAELRYYNRNATLAFFPSLYEGFGLPIVEAMGEGTPVLTSNISSMPEIVGDSGILCNPYDINDMSEKIQSALSNPDLLKEFGARAKNRARCFSWDRAEKQYEKIFRSLSDGCMDEPICLGEGKSPRLKVAFFSPVRPQKSGIAIYNQNLILELKKYVDIHLFLDDGVIPEDPSLGDISYYSYKEFGEIHMHHPYDQIIYHMGNNTLHKYIYETLLKYPGIAVLHDYVLHPFVQHITALDGKPAQYIQEMKEAYGDEGERIANSFVHGIYPPVDFMKYPLNEKIINVSQAIIVHSNFVKGLIYQNDKTHVIPLGRSVVHLDQDLITETRVKFGLDANSLVIGCFGYMNPNKRVSTLLKVFYRLATQYTNLLLILVGDINPSMRHELLRFSRENSIEDNIRIIGYVPEDQYFGYLSCADIVVNLRHPTMGETSGTQLDAMAFGKPLIVSNIGSYAEIPDSCCWKVDLGDVEEEELYEYLRALVTDKQLRDRMGRNSQKYLEKYHSWEDVGKQYLKIILDGTQTPCRQ